MKYSDAHPVLGPVHDGVEFAANSPLQIHLDRAAKLSLSEQIRSSIARAIESGLLPPGSRLPSWQSLATYLGVARGTVQTAYERLTDAQMIEAFGAKGTLVTARPGPAVNRAEERPPSAFVRTYQEMRTGPAVFQLGVPALDDTPGKVFARARSSNLLKTGPFSSVVYPDPLGERRLRQEIAGHLAISRNLHCLPEQVFITSGYTAGLGLVLRVLGLEGRKAWMEDPGYLLTRKGLELAGMRPISVPVDDEGLDVDHGITHAHDAALAVVTPGQQAPLGTTLSLRRRLQLLQWAAASDAWIVEDDYLGELQLGGRAAPALASLDEGKRVIHVGTFSKTISPSLRLGFVVAPLRLVAAFAEVATALAPAPSPVVQLTTAQFMREGHYVRRVRRLKRLYSAQRDALCEQLDRHDAAWTSAGLALLVPLPDGALDVEIVREAITMGMAPSPLSRWFASLAWTRPGLLLGVATAPETQVEASCRRLFEIIDRYRERAPRLT
ncbi:PLP-dependent aminotransferase family protein [Cupriavidus plantarum]|uniref:MocR-like pyridoxine biosynthesis transcription factor PdxR n=1 Tax=Cupriavidus plantarum TaxID=942865 RepID=UPI0015C9A141|nr:PLP-dependent aminotransferase family protein [Cupriavidus plantarum]NYH98554.1 GntR family transcriptional regulator/MocR family aminotransferase [Cupriavidus plantarum]